MATSPYGHEIDGRRRCSRSTTLGEKLRVSFKITVSTIAKDLSRDFLIRRRVRIGSAANAGRDVRLRRLVRPDASHELVRQLDPGEAGCFKPSLSSSRSSHPTKDPHQSSAWAS